MSFCYNSSMLRTRYLRILIFFAGILLNVGWWDILLPRFGMRAYSQRTRAERFRRAAAHFRRLAVQMGGVMIKVGQFLSARLDVLPREVTDELSGLQDEVKAEPFADIRSVIESEFQQTLEEKFSEFQPTPMASASIGQVHFARILQTDEGQPDSLENSFVVVKVQRPQIERIIETDLAALRVVGNWLQAFPPIRKRANVPALLSEFSRSLYEEIDYLHEGRNAEAFAKNFNNRPEVRVPSVYWSHTTRRVLTLENVLAIKITDYSAIEAAGVDRKEIADRLFDTYLKQVFEDRFFHADPHPGNLFVFPLSPLPGEKNTPWKLVFVDFGMTGTIPSSLLDALREMFIGVGTQDSARIIQSYQMMGVLLPGADTELLEKAGARVFERFWGKSTTEMVNMGHDEAIQFVHEFSSLIYELPFQIPENLILLGRCLAILSGIATGLDPDFNIWVSVEPYTQKLIASESGHTVEYILKEAVGELTALVNLPKKMDSLLNRLDQGRLDVRTPQLSEQIHRLERSMRRFSLSLLFVGLFLGGIQLFLAGYSALALAILIFALFVLIGTLR